MRALFLLLLCGTAAVRGQTEVTAERTSGGWTIANGIVRLDCSRAPEGGIREEYAAWSGTWRLLLASGGGDRPDPEIFCDGGSVVTSPDTVRLLSATPESATVEIGWTGGTHEVRKLITLRRGEHTASVVVRLAMGGRHELARALSAYRFLPDEGGIPDFIWTPQLRPGPSDVIADHTFRTPALILQKGAWLAALIPDVERIQPWRSVETAADLQVAEGAAPVLRYGGMNWRARSHVFYTHSDLMTTQILEGRFSYGFTLLLGGHFAPRAGYREVTRFCWEKWGRPRLQSGKGPQSAPFSDYIRKAWKEYLPQIAVRAELNGRPVTLLTQQRLAWSNALPASANTDNWFSVWFNSLRTAYGAVLHARSTGDTALAQIAEGVLELALLAPEHQGLRPSIFYLDSAGGHWVNDHGWGGIDGGRNLAMFHNCWTAYWMLRWGDEEPARRAEALRAATSLAEFLLKAQRPGGVIPSWYDPVTLAPVDVFSAENAETAGAALFLAELYRRSREPRHLAGAERAFGYILREIVPRQKWFDFETFFSCSRKEVGFFDRFTGQYAQNTLSMHQAAEAALALYEVTGKKAYLESGRGLLEYLALYQQVWSPPWLSRELFGGFGVQNTDGEWSDARQGYVAVALMRYYEATGEREYLERGVSALRAMFSLFESPSSPRCAENYAHGAIDRPGGVTGIHWGTGSSAVSIHLFERSYGGAHVNVAGGWGCGIDGCTVTDVRVTGDSITVTIRDDVDVPRPLRVTFGGVEAGSRRVLINGRDLGEIPSEELKRGREITL